MVSMRIFVLLLLLALAGCTGNPGALGITGPRDAQVVPQATDAETGAMNPELKSNRYAPSMVPTTDGGRYWGYN